MPLTKLTIIKVLQVVIVIARLSIVVDHRLYLLLPWRVGPFSLYLTPCLRVYISDIELVVLVTAKLNPLNLFRFTLFQLSYYRASSVDSSTNTSDSLNSSSPFSPGFGFTISLEGIHAPFKHIYYPLCIDVHNVHMILFII